MSKPEFEITHGPLPETLAPAFFFPRVREHLDEVLDLMAVTWGYRPALQLNSRLGLYITSSRTFTWPNRTYTRTYRKFLRVDKDPGASGHPYAMAYNLAVPLHRDRFRITAIKRPWPAWERTPAGYAAVLRQALERYGQKLLAPVRVTESLVISVDFDINGFQHDGQRVNVTEDNCRRRTPRVVAYTFAREVAAHRNTCKECGCGIPPLYQRANWRRYGIQYREGLERGMVYKNGVTVHDPVAAQRVLALNDTPPDPVERLLMPQLADKLLQVLRSVNRPTEWDPSYLVCGTEALAAEAG